MVSHQIKNESDHDKGTAVSWGLVILCSGPMAMAQGQDGLTRACPVVVILVVPPLRQQAFPFPFPLYLVSDV